MIPDNGLSTSLAAGQYEYNLNTRCNHLNIFKTSYRKIKDKFFRFSVSSYCQGNHNKSQEVAFQRFRL